MKTYKLDKLSHFEVKILRQGLQDIKILGKDAMEVGILQNKLNQLLKEVNQDILKESQEKGK